MLKGIFSCLIVDTICFKCFKTCKELQTQSPDPQAIRSQDVQLFLYRKSEGKCGLVDFSPTAKMPLPCHPFHLHWLEPFIVCRQFSSVHSPSRVRLFEPIDCSTPGLPVHHQLPEPAQTHVHRVSDAIQASHPLSSPSPPAFDLSQNQGLSR